MLYLDTNVKGTIIPIASGTRLRNIPTTKGSVITSAGPSDIVEVDLVREYKETVLAEYVTINDLWGRVIKINGVVASGWMAIKYHRVTPPDICRPNYTVLGDTEPPAPVEIIGLTLIPKLSDGTDGSPIEMVKK